MKSKKVLIIGGVGNASSIAYAMIDAFEKGYKELEFVGYINDRDKLTHIEGYPVIGGLDDIPELIRQNYYFINTMGKIRHQPERIIMLENIDVPNDNWATFIHPSAYVAPTVKLGVGCVVMPNANICPSTILGKSCRVMTGALIGHNNIIGDYCVFSASSCTGSFLTIGNGVIVSLNATIKEFLTIGDYATIGMGAVLLKNVGESEVWVGNPAKQLIK
jgi:acetyltransferase EpsM